MQNWGLLFLVIGVLVANLPAVMQQWRTDRPGFIKTLWLIGIYALYVALGLALILFLLPCRERHRRDRPAAPPSQAAVAADPALCRSRRHSEQTGGGHRLRSAGAGRSGGSGHARHLDSAGRGQRHQCAPCFGGIGKVRRARGPREERRRGRRQSAQRVDRARWPRLRPRADGYPHAGHGRGRSRPPHSVAISAGSSSGRGAPANHRSDRNRLRRGPRGLSEAGLDDYLAKPFEKADLAALFARWRNLGRQPEKRAGGAA
jgi:hypothetical protein